MSLNWHVYIDYAPELLGALSLTVMLTIITLVTSTLLGAPLAVLRDSGPRVVRALIHAFSWITRTTPVLVVLFIAFYGFPLAGVNIDALPIAIVGLSIQCTGYNLEIIRGGLRSVPVQQQEAVRALGLPRFRGWLQIVVRQSLPALTPPYFSNATHILKTTSIASVITVREITGETRNLIGLTYAAIEMLLAAAVLYVILASLMILVQAVVERAVALPANEQQRVKR